MSGRSVRWLAVSSALAALAALAACYEPSFTPCTITCAPDGDPCPGGMTCGPGNVCIEPGGTCADLSGPVHRTIVAGIEHVCAIDEANRILCWGGNSRGQLAVPTMFRDGDPVVVAPPVQGGTWIGLAAGDFHTCGLYDDGSAADILCWGDNAAGQLGPLSTTDARFFRPAAVLERNWVGVGAGGGHSCAIAEELTGGTSVYCWGANGAGQVTGSPGIDISTPIAAPTPAVTGTWRMVDGGAGHTCATTTAAELVCWGDNTSAQLTGTGTTPRLVDGAYAFVAAGAAHTCAITRAGTVSCWGDNPGGLLGVGSGDAIVAAPTPVADRGTTERWAQLDTSARTTCGNAIGVGTLCWGTDPVPLGLGNLGVGQATPVVEVTGALALDVAVTPSTTCVHGGANDIRCWGDSPHGELGDGTRTIQWDAVEIAAPGALWVSVQAGARHTCGVQRDGAGMFRTLCWGLANHGQSGVPIGPFDVNPEPRPMENLDANEPRVAVGAAHTCVVRTRIPDSEVRCWGDDSLGQNPADEPGTPFTVADEANPQITADGDFTCVTGSTTHTPQCWGTPDADGTHASDMPMPRATNVTLREESVAWSATSACGLATVNRAVWCFGTEQIGELGNGPDGPPVWPTAEQVDVLPTGFEVIARGPGRTRCAGADTLGVHCWGDNAQGQVLPSAPGGAFDVPTQTLSAAQINTAIDAIAIGGTHGCAIYGTNQAFQCWGGRDAGQRTRFPTSAEPTQITNPAAGVVSWQAVTAGAEHTCAIVTTSAGAGHLLCWGRNTYGQIGTNVSARPIPGPILIP